MLICYRLWVSALAIGIVILVEFMMVLKIKSRKPIPIVYKGIHVVATIIGAVIALIAAITTDSRLWTNIILVTLIVILGVALAVGKLKKKTVLYLYYIISNY